MTAERNRKIQLLDVHPDLDLPIEIAVRGRGLEDRGSRGFGFDATGRVGVLTPAIEAAILSVLVATECGLSPPPPNGENVMATQCPICDGELALNEDLVSGELFECPECGTELEVKSLEPVVVAEAPTEDEDWGE